jgi:hypothetical protein
MNSILALRTIQKKTFTQSSREAEEQRRTSAALPLCFSA